MDRLVSELEAIWSSFAIDHDGQPTGVEWLPADHVGQALCSDLGYEDMPEFEDALKGAWAVWGVWGVCCGVWVVWALWGVGCVGTECIATGCCRAQCVRNCADALQPQHNTHARTHPAPTGSFEQFLDHLPHVIKDVRNGRCYFQIRPDPPQ